MNRKGLYQTLKLAEFNNIETELSENIAWITAARNANLSAGSYYNSVVPFPNL